ncbi:hypothetical protein [Candidatus Methylocalor cossyra]|uniref:Uncharacterized protein n=1 Tax=Candidatus Methylocalor cossyra TaxID=3108543 RepID=A0ABM9NHI2_9GAMM
MTRCPRFAVFLVLALMQMLAPWVHAHTGLERGGFLHLPGLENLARRSADDCAAAASQADQRDLIVAMQAGRWDRPAEAPDRSDLPQGLPPAFSASLAGPTIALPVAGRRWWPPRIAGHEGQPRAPPPPLSRT